jgi:hypothetical protein
MAWMALYKWFIPWRKTNYINEVSWYRGYLYDEWFNSLSEEDKQKELNRIETAKAKRKRDGEQALARLYGVFSYMDHATNGMCSEYMRLGRNNWF